MNKILLNILLVAVIAGGLGFYGGMQYAGHIHRASEFADYRAGSTGLSRADILYFRSAWNG